MPCASQSLSLRLPGRPGRKGLDDATLGHSSATVTRRADTAQFRREPFEIGNLVLDGPPLLFGYLTYLGTGWAVFGRQPQ